MSKERAHDFVVPDATSTGIFRVASRQSPRVCSDAKGCLPGTVQSFLSQIDSAYADVRAAVKLNIRNRPLIHNPGGTKIYTQDYLTNQASSFSSSQRTQLGVQTRHRPLDDVLQVFRQYQLGKVQPPKHARPREPVRTHCPQYEEPNDRPDAPRESFHPASRP